MKYCFLGFLFFFSFMSMAQNQISLYFPSTNQLKQNIVFLDSFSNINTFIENFYLNGRKRSEGNAANDIPIGVWNYYDTTGNLIESYNHDLQFNFNYSQQLFLLLDSLIVKNIDLNFLNTFDEAPHFIGGNFEFLEFLKSNIRYPIEAKKAKVQGCVIVYFEVDVNGNISNPKIRRGIGFGCDDEALRVVSLMGKWVPAKKMEKNISTVFNLPILFSNPN